MHASTGTLDWNRYGKSLVRVMKVTRESGRHDLRELTVNIGLEGDFNAAHTEGDNAAVLPTDTMKNTVYALARNHPIGSIEAFALHLSRHFVSAAPSVHRAGVEIIETLWRRVITLGEPHPHTFQRAGGETPTCMVTVGPEGVSVVSGLRDLVILKTARSGFSGFFRDQYTTLKETDDRLLGTSVTARWPVGEGADFKSVRIAVRSALIDSFAAHDSLSVQQTLYAMAEAALEASRDINEITLSMPNKHCLLVDLSPFGMTNPNEVFLPIDEPHGLIEATIRRA